MEYEGPNTHLQEHQLKRKDLEYSLYQNGAVKNAQIRDRSIFAFLLNQLPDSAPHYKLVYQNWKYAFLSPVDPSKRSASEGAPGDGAWKADKYACLIRSLPFEAMKLIDLALEPYPYRPEITIAIHKPQLFARAFDMLAVCIDAIGNNECNCVACKNLLARDASPC